MLPNGRAKDDLNDLKAAGGSLTMAQKVRRKNPQTAKQRDSRVHDLEERREFLAHFLRAREREIPAAEIAQELGVSVATLYRWLRKQEALDGVSSFTGLAAVERAITTLCNPSSSEKYGRLDAIFRFSAWLRWPNDPAVHDVAVTSCAVSYIRRSTGADTLAELSPADLSYLGRHLRLDTLSRMCSSEAIDFPYFADFRIDDQPHTQRNVIADVIWFLLACEYHRSGGRANPSLSKAHFLLENNAFRYRWGISRRTFQTFWAANAAAAPFLYVEQAHSTLDWAIDPLAVAFSDDVDHLVSEEQAVCEYFARCRWAVEELRSRLDPRALERISYPAFPHDVVAEKSEPTFLTPLIRETLSRY